jgi:hypothetical protein
MLSRSLTTLSLGRTAVVVDGLVLPRVQLASGANSSAFITRSAFLSREDGIE